MERLGGVGAAFLAVESATNPMHVATLVVLDTTPAPGFGFDTVRRHVDRRLHLLPPLRRRVLEVPFALGRPVLVDDPDFDLDDHLHRVVVPVPGTAPELAGLVGAILARPLARHRPLWELHVVEGLADGGVALLAKMHHAVADGVVGAELLLRLFDADPHPEPPAPGPAWAPGALPGPAELLGGALDELAGAPEAILRAARATVAAVTRALPPTGPPPALFGAPRTAFNVPLSPERAVAWADLPVEAVKGVKRAFGCTFSDVVLAVCSSAVRTHLAGTGQVPEGDLVALVPRAAAPRHGGPALPNLLTPALVPLATTVDDPAQRLRAIAAGAARVREHPGVLDPLVVREWADAAAPVVLSAAARVVAGLGLPTRLPPACNLIVSNVAGPPFPLHLAGARVAALVPFGPIFDGVALNVTVLSHAGSLHAGVAADRAAVPDPAAVAGLLAPALDELRPEGGAEARC